MVPSMRSSFSSLHKRKRSRMSLSHAPSSISRGRGPLASPSLTCSLNPVQNSSCHSVMIRYKSSPLKGQTKLSTHTPEMTPFTLMRKIVRTGPIKSPAVFQKYPKLSIEQQEPRIPSSTKASRRSHTKSLTKLNIQPKVIVDKALKPCKRWKHQSRVDPQAFAQDGNNSISLQMTTFEGSAEDSVQGRNMHRNACCETRRMNHQFFFKRPQEMESNNLTQVENDDNYEMLVPNQGQKEENVHCTPMLQIGMRSNDRTVTECDKNVSQDEPTTRAEPENTSSQPSSNRSSKAAANSGHSFESPAAAEGGMEEEVGGQGSMGENEIFNEAEAIVIAEKLGMKFMLQEDEAFLHTINEDNDLDRNQGEGKTLSLPLNTLEMSAEEHVRRRNMRRNARRETRRVVSQLFLKKLQEMDSSNLTEEENDYNGCLDNGNYNTLLPNQGQKQDNVLEGLNGQMHCTPMLQTGTRGNDNTVTEYDESVIQDEPACPAGPEGTSSNQSKAAMNSGHSFESPATAEVGIEEEGDWQGSMGEHEILHEAEVIGRVVAEKLGMKSMLQGEEASLGTSHEDQNLDRHQGEGKTLSLPLNTLERSAEERVRRRNMRKNARHDARRVTHQAFLKRLLEMDSSNLANEEHDYVGCLDNDNYDMLVPNQGQKQDIVLEDLNGQMHCTPILQAETRKNDKTVTEFHKSDIHGEPASQAEPGGSSSQPSSNRSKAAMNSGHSFENPATAEVGIEEEGDWQGSMEEHEILHEAEVIGRVSEKLGMKSMLQGEEASLGTSHEDQNLDRNQGEGKTSNLQLNTLERSAEERVRRRNMRKNARHDARRVTHQAFLKRLQQMDSSKLTEEENDGNDFLDNDNFHILVANQGQEEDNVLEDLNGQMHCTPILQTGMRRNDKTVTEYDKNDIQGEPASQADPEGTSSQPLSNRSKAAMNSGHSFENPATAEGGSEEEGDGQGSMEENEMLHEADAIDRVITEKLGMKFMLQGEEFSLDTSDEENDLNRIDGTLPHEESTLFENLLSFVEESPDMSRAQKSGMLPLQEITLFENQLSLVKATPDMSRVRKSRKANNKSGSTRKVVKPRMRKETQLSIPGKAIKNVLSRYSRCPVKPATVRAVQERFPEFLAQMCDDLEAYALHAGRKTVKPADVELLLKRQGHITDTMPLEALIRQHMPMQERALLLPMACAHNRLEPAPKHFKNWH